MNDDYSKKVKTIIFKSKQIIQCLPTFAFNLNDLRKLHVCNTRMLQNLKKSTAKF